jgi:hypothetical protein
MKQLQPSLILVSTSSKLADTKAAERQARAETINNVFPN